MSRLKLVLFTACFLAVLYAANLAQAAPGTVSSPKAAPLEADTLIDSKNLAEFRNYLPLAAQSVVEHGFRIRVVPTRRLDWSRGFTQATEKYSPQVGLDKDGNIVNYVAGAPFPAVDLSDPKAAEKIAYNWHLGPFMPDDFSLAPWGSFAYSGAEGTSGPIIAEDYYDFSCDRLSFLRYAHRTEVDPRPVLGSDPQGFEWKARCNKWTQNPMEGIGEGAGIWLRFINPHRPDEFYNFEPHERRIRRQASWDTLDENCRSCHQPYWAYALPKTEEASYRLLGTISILACLSSSGEPAGIVRSERTFTMTEEPFELRSAYILEMTPKIRGFDNLRTLVYIDTEAYVWLAAEFFDGNERTETAIPLWHSHPSPEGGNLFDLAGEFYIPLKAAPENVAHPTGYGQPGYAKWFFRSLVPAHGEFDQKINTGDVPEKLFNPQAMAR